MAQLEQGALAHSTKLLTMASVWDARDAIDQDIDTRPCRIFRSGQLLKLRSGLICGRSRHSGHRLLETRLMVTKAHPPAGWSGSKWLATHLCPSNTSMRSLAFVLLERCVCSPCSCT